MSGGKENGRYLREHDEPLLGTPPELPSHGRGPLANLPALERPITRFPALGREWHGVGGEVPELHARPPLGRRNGVAKAQRGPSLTRVTRTVSAGGTAASSEMTMNLSPHRAIPDPEARCPREPCHSRSRGALVSLCRSASDPGFVRLHPRGLVSSRSRPLAALTANMAGEQRGPGATTGASPARTSGRRSRHI